MRQKICGRGKKVVFALLILLSIRSPLTAEVWTSGHHEIYDGDPYGEVLIYNDVQLDIFGGDLVYVWAYDNTITNWYDGEMGYFVAHDDSIVDIYGGKVLITLGADANSVVNLYSSDLIEMVSLWDNSVLNLYAYDVIHHATGGYSDDGWIEGKYILDDTEFSIDLIKDSFSNINIVPEPSTLLFFSLGGLILRKKRL
jgi:hypothetical protein